MKPTNEVNYSPGPWKLLHHPAPQHDGDRAVYAPGNKLICEMNGGPNDNSETLANARLIASVPELLMAARLALRYLKTKKDYGLIEQKLNDAIEKAEGRI